MLHVEDVGDVILIFIECNAVYVEDIEDRSNTLRAVMLCYRRCQ